MHATNRSLFEFIKNEKIQFFIPVYQRNYDWQKPHCQTLLDDIKHAAAKKTEHFTGSIIYIEDKEGVYTVIDGQQRLTTITLIYIVIYQLLKKERDNQKPEIVKKSIQKEIDRIELILKTNSGVGHPKIKLKVTDNNQAILEAILNGTVSTIKEAKTNHLVFNYEYFQKTITQKNSEEIEKGIEKLTIIDVCLDKKKDDAQKIFHTINATGLVLSEADKVRNYVLMTQEPTTQEKFYHDYWVHIENNCKQQSTNKNMTSHFIRFFLTIKGSLPPKLDEVYNKFNRTYQDLNAIETTLKAMEKYSQYYSLFINPNKENISLKNIDQQIKINAKIQNELRNLNIIKATVSYPLLLNVFEDYYHKKEIKVEQVVAILQTIQSYCFRLFIAGDTKKLSNFFPTVYRNLEAVEASSYVRKIQSKLVNARGKNKFSTDKEVKEKLKTKDLYHSEYLEYCFAGIEDCRSKEAPDFNDKKFSCEHIFPQNPSKEWKKTIKKKDYQKFSTMYLNTIANLTYTVNNTKMSNKIFKEKKRIGYKESNLRINDEIKHYNKWTIANMEDRFEKLFKNFVTIWKYPEGIKIAEGAILSDDILQINDAAFMKIFSYSLNGGDKIEVAKSNFTNFFFDVVKKFYDMNSTKFFVEACPIKIVDKEGNEVVDGKPLYDRGLENLKIFDESKGYQITTHGTSQTKLGHLQQLIELFNDGEEDGEYSLMVEYSYGDANTEEDE